MRPAPPVWSEEELRYLDPPPARTGPRSLAGSLRRSLSVAPATPHETTRSSIIHTPNAVSHGNFIDASYRRILANPDWKQRLTKAHSAKRQARACGAEETVREWHELDAATSSDALLMNIFCYPRVLADSRLPALLGVARGLEPVFGFRPELPLVTGRRGKPLKDRSEIDMQFGPLLVEAKLTETDFQYAPLRLLERYPAFDEVFDRDCLEISARGVRSYQLLRGVLIARSLGDYFCVIVDRRRPELTEAWFTVIRAVRDFELRTRLRLLTWQEIAATLPLQLRVFLATKYGIEAV
jgi:hypothetical protein